MATILFNEIVYGPVHSRRLGCSLGINLSPADGKRCTFDCVYCECGLNKDRKTMTASPDAAQVEAALTAKAVALKADGITPDVITFSGNGEPTMNPRFPEIIDAVIRVRNKTFPQARVTVLSNSTMLHKENIISALLKADEILMKLDAADNRLLNLIDRPAIKDFTAEKLIEQLCFFSGKLTIQTIFLRGEHQGENLDNTGDEAVNRWLEALQRIRPQKVMLYTISRETPIKTLQAVKPDELEAIASKARAAGFEALAAV